MDVVYSNKTVKPEVKPVDSEEPGIEMPAVPNWDEMKATDVANGMGNGVLQTNDEGGGYISFHNISYAVEQRVCLKKRPPKIILNNVRSVSSPA